MLSYINKALVILGFRLERIQAPALRYQRGSKVIAGGTSLFYAFLGWFGISFFDISPSLGERGANCALHFVFSSRTVWLFFFAVVLMALYLVRPHLKPMEAAVGKGVARMAWRVIMFFAFLWVGFFQALGAVVLGIAIYVAQHEFKTSIPLFFFAVMSLVVGLMLKIQGPELLWKIRRQTKQNSLTGAVVSMGSVIVIALIAAGLTYGNLGESMKPPAAFTCPKPSIIWG